jgi:lysozyme
MKLSNNGAKLIKEFEGLVLHPYKDVAGIWTIGYGFTSYADGNTVKAADKPINKKQADELFSITHSQYETAVNKFVLVPLTQNQFDALVSFTYNEGTGALKQSTLLKKLNVKDYTAAAACFSAWNKITDPHTGKKVVCDTLTKRRTKESNLFKQL